MNSHYIYSLKFEEKKKLTSYVIIFFPLIDNPDIDLDDSVKEFFTSNSPKDSAILLFPDFQKHLIAGMIENQVEAIKRLKSFTYDKDVRSFCYNKNGLVEEIDVKHGKLNNKLIHKLKQEGLYQIFYKRGGFLEADDTFHYILPSGTHSKLFIRVGNILTCGNEINFIAFCLLPFFDDSVRYIYCDSASISSLAYSLILLKSKILNENKLKIDLPLVESFGGYEKIKDFRFKAENSLVLISTSTSGALKNDIVKTHKLDKSSIITLYYNGDTDEDNNILINLYTSPYKERLNNFFLKTFKSEVDCAYCNSNSIPVKLSGDQFLPAKSAIELVLVKKDHRPFWLNKFMEQFHGKKIIKCHYGNVPPKIREFYLDLERVHNEINIEFEHEVIKDNAKKQKSYATEFYKFLENNLPITVEHIICLPDPASEQMAKQIQAYLKNKKLSANVLKYKEFIRGTGILDKNITGTVLVVSSSIATGKKLYQLSLKFRDYDHISVFYFFGICRTPNKEILETLKSDLTYRKDIINLNKLDFLENIYIPDRHTDFGKELENSPWRYEKVFLLEILKPFFEKETLNIEIIENRIKVIDNAENKLGISEGLFWPKLKVKTDLELRKQFAFFDFNYNTDKKRLVSQSDVYFTISSILHNLRSNNEDGKHRLFQHEHKRSLIAPQTFTRYSDGLIQACFLRGAQPGELNYSIDFNVSYDMKKSLLSIFDDPNSDDSEALYEFLYSISIGKIKLLKRDMIDFISTLEGKYKDYPIVLGLCKFIKQNNLE